ncbi:hypothetical protein Y023_6351 [Burkholderia pseudomallei A79D]|nr:hypothetical protein Y023_6351 [Burkholderia pseudomallei A79D]KGY04523.1 hypothetical protein X997_6358 [Burkholderia pseudomallei A79C]
MIDEPDLDAIRDRDVLGIVDRERGVRDADDDRAGLFAFGGYGNQRSCLGNLLLRDDLRQVEHPADTGLVVEYLFVEVALGRCFYDKRIERGNNGSDDVCEILRFRIAVGDAQTCRKSVR